MVTRQLTAPPRALALLVAAVLAVTLVVACGGTDTNYCPSGGNDAWTSRSYSVIRTEPRNCPYVVSAAKESLAFNVTVLAPTTTAGLDAEMWVQRSQMNYYLSGTYSGPMTPYPSDSINKRAINFVGKWMAGDSITCYPSACNPPYPLRDSAVFEAGDVGKLIMDGGALVTGYLALPGKINSAPGQASGSGWVNSGARSNWADLTPEDTLSYRYQWLTDGVAATGATARTYSTSFWNGRHTLAVITTRSDDKADTSALVVTVNLAAGLSGPDGVRPTYACSRSASAAGGVPPFHYAWTLDGYAVGDDSDWWSDDLPAGSHWLQVSISDAVGQHSTSPALTIWSDATQPSCDI